MCYNKESDFCLQYDLIVFFLFVCLFVFLPSYDLRGWLSVKRLTTMMMMMMVDSSQTRIWKGWRSVLTWWLVAVESDSWCAESTALWTGEGLGWRWLGGCLLSLPPILRLSFAALCLCLDWLFSADERQLSWSEASYCHDWWLIPVCASASCPFGLSLSQINRQSTDTTELPTCRIETSTSSTM